MHELLRIVAGDSELGARVWQRSAAEAVAAEPQDDGRVDDGGGEPLVVRRQRLERGDDGLELGPRLGLPEKLLR